MNSRAAERTWPIGRQRRHPALVTNPGAHIDLLVALLSRDAQGVAGLARSESPEVLDAFGAFARRNQLSGFVHTLIADPALAASVPAKVQGELQRRHAMESRKRKLLHRELVTVIDAFRAGGVECIILKGPELASRFYGSDDQRSYWDLDLLVRRDSLTVSRRVLRECGFERQSNMLFGERISLAMVHALDYWKGEVELDLHWQLSNHPSFGIDYRQLWERREPWSLSGRACSVLSADYELTLNLLSCLKDIERGAFRLRSFVDLWTILTAIDADFDWERFFAERSTENVRRICTGVLALFLQLFHAASRFPRLSRELRRHDLPRIGTREAAIELIEPAFLAPARRLWVSRLYQISRTRHVVWWALSLPVRLTVYKPGKVKRLTHYVRTWLRRQ